MRRLPNSLVALAVLLMCSGPLHAQDAAAPTERGVDDPSPNHQFAFLRTHQTDSEPQRTCDLIEKDSGKVLLRVAASDVDQDRLDNKILWTADSKRFAVFSTYNHFGAELSVFAQIDGVFRQLTLPHVLVPEMSQHLKRGHEWKWTEINSATAERWQKDGTLVVRFESTLYELNGFLILISQLIVTFGFSKSGKVTILKSTQKVFAHDERD